MNISRRETLADLDIYMADDLSELTFVRAGDVLCSIQDPNLLWECSCEASSGGRSPETGPCRIHTCENGDIVSRLFGINNRIWYRGLPVNWDGDRSWPPAIDSFLLVQALLNNGWPTDLMKRIWDMGAGTGFVGMQLANARPWIDELVAVEIDPNAAEQCVGNFDRLAHERKIELEVLNKPAEEVSTKTFERGDVIVANPPYLPSLSDSSKGPFWPNAAIGTHLLEHLIRLVNEAEVPLAICYSDLANQEVRKAVTEGGNPDIEILAKREVPLRVYLPHNYVEWLLTERGLIHKRDALFAFWHTVRVAVFTPSQGGFG